MLVYWWHVLSIWKCVQSYIQSHWIRSGLLLGSRCQDWNVKFLWVVLFTCAADCVCQWYLWITHSNIGVSCPLVHETKGYYLARQEVGASWFLLITKNLPWYFDSSDSTGELKNYGTPRCGLMGTRRRFSTQRANEQAPPPESKAMYVSIVVRWGISHGTCFSINSSCIRIKSRRNTD